MGARGGVRGVDEKAADDFFVKRGGGKIFRLIEVVGRRVVAVGEPVLEDFLFGRAGKSANVHFDGGNAFDNEAVLIASNEAISKRLLIGNSFDAERRSDGRGVIAEIGLFKAFHFEKFQRDDGEEHVYVDVRGQGFCGDSGMRSEVTRAEEALFLGSDENKKKRAAELFGMGFEVGRDVEKDGASARVVHGAVVEAVAVHGFADADVVEMRREDDEFVFEDRIGAGKFSDEIGGLDLS